MRRVTIVIWLLPIVLLGCDRQDEIPTVPPTLTIAPSHGRVEVGDSIPFAASVTGVDRPVLRFTTGDSAVAAVIRAEGNVGWLEGRRAGSTELIARVDGTGLERRIPVDVSAAP